MSEYISHEQYTDMLKNFGKSTPKGLLKENLEKEGNAFTAGLAKTPKGGEFKVGNKQFKDKTNYDAPIKEDGSEGVEVIGHLGGNVYKIRTVEGEEVDLEFDEEVGEEVDPPYGYEGTLCAEHGDYEYTIPAAFIKAGGGSFDVEPRFKEIEAHSIKQGSVKEYQFDQMYPDDPGPFEGREDVCPVCKQDPCVCNMKEEEQRPRPRPTLSDFRKMSSKEIEDYLKSQEDKPFGPWGRSLSDIKFILKQKKETEKELEKEGLNLPSKDMQATSAMVQTVKEDGQNAAYNFSVLSPSEKDRLREYINSIKTIKEEINKLVNKAKSSGAMMESGKVEVKPNPAVATAHKTAAAKDHKAKPGGNRTGLVMPKGEVWENEGMAANVNPKIQTILSKLIDSLKAEGLSEHDIKMFIDHEIEEKGKEAVASQYDF